MPRSLTAQILAMLRGPALETRQQNLRAWIHALEAEGSTPMEREQAASDVRGFCDWNRKLFPPPLAGVWRALLDRLRETTVAGAPGPSSLPPIEHVDAPSSPAAPPEDEEMEGAEPQGEPEHGPGYSG